MKAFKDIELTLLTPEDVVAVRQQVRKLMGEMGFSLIDQTKMVTAASELGRNAVLHGNGGTAIMESLEDGHIKGLRLIFEDHGPGIPDIEKAMEDGYTTQGGMGLGLGGSRRLVNEFDIQSSPGIGTRVSISKWIQI